MNETVDEIKVVKLSGLKRRLLIILNNNVRFLESSKIYQLLMQAYRSGTVDKEYSSNYVCINLRELHSMGLIDNRKGNRSFGRTSLYAINEDGRNQLMANLHQKSDNNNSVVVERDKTYYNKDIVSDTKDISNPQLLLSNSESETKVHALKAELSKRLI